MNAGTISNGNKKLFAKIQKLSREQLNEPADLFFVGLGMNDTLNQLTEEARIVLEKARVIFYISVFPFPLTHLNAINLLEDYKHSDDIDVLHNHLSDLIIAEASRAPGVCYAPYGHPLFIDNIARVLLAKAKQKKLRIKIIPGLSSFDVLLSVLQLDILPYGMHLYNANELLLYQQVLDPGVPTFIFSIGSVGTQFYTREKENHPERFHQLQEYLKQFYSPSHTVFLLFYSDIDIEKRKTTIGAFHQFAADIIDGTTLFIPAEKARKKDAAYEEAINNPANISLLVKTAVKQRNQ